MLPTPTITTGQTLQISKIDLNPSKTPDISSPFKDSITDSHTLPDDTFSSRVMLKWNTFSQNMHQRAQTYDFSGDYNPLTNMDQQSTDEVSVQSTKYSDDDLGVMYKGDRKVSEHINKMDSHSIDPSKYLHSKKDSIQTFLEDSWNQRLPTFSTQRITTMKETAVEVSEMSDVFHTLSEKEIQSSIRSTLTGIAKDEAIELGKEAPKQLYKAVTSLDFDKTMQVINTTKDGVDLSYQYTTLSDDKVDEFTQSFKDMQKVNGGQILLNMTMNTGLNSGLTTTGKILQTAPHPLAKGVGIGLQGAAKANQAVTTYSNVQTLSGVFDKKEAMEKEHPGTYGKILAGLKESASEKRMQQSSLQTVKSEPIDVQQKDIPQTKETQFTGRSTFFMDDQRLFNQMSGIDSTESYQQQSVLNGNGLSSLSSQNIDFSQPMDLEDMFAMVRDLPIGSTGKEHSTLSSVQEELVDIEIESDLDDDELEQETIVQNNSISTTQHNPQSKVIKLSDDDLFKLMLD